MKEEGKYGRKEKKNKANEVKTEQGQEDVEIIKKKYIKVKKEQVSRDTKQVWGD